MEQIALAYCIRILEVSSDLVAEMSVGHFLRARYSELACVQAI